LRQNRADGLVIEYTFTVWLALRGRWITRRQER
jgi:hypothetical protein